MKINNAAIAAALVASSLDMAQTAKAGDQKVFGMNIPTKSRGVVRVYSPTGSIPQEQS